MKRILFVLMLISVMCEAQVAEVSLKGGAFTYGRGQAEDMASRMTYPVGYAGSIAFTFGLPAGFRLGLAGSSYDVRREKTYWHFDNDGNRTKEFHKYYRYGQPLIPVELLLMKRFNAGRLRIDVGGSLGVCLNKRMIETYDHAPSLNTDIIDRNNTWSTYGTLAGLQYRLGCRTAIGAEVQPKWLKIQGGDPFFAMPVMLKFSYSL